MTSLANEARLFLRSTRRGILSTLSSKFSGYPFGSVAPFVLDHNAAPIILISNIAEHTKNIVANPKVSLVVFAGEDDLQANARLTLLGEAIETEKSEIDLRTRYLRYHPQAASYFDMHDFAFYRIHITHARYIAGFGKMGWLEGSALNTQDLTTPMPLATQETAIIEHMNADHGHSMIAYCQHFHGITATSATMLGIDSDGFDVSAQAVALNTEPETTELKSQTLRFNFSTPIHDAMSARKALVEMSKVAMPNT